LGLNVMLSLLAGVKVKNCIGAASVSAIAAEAVSATSGVMAPSAERAAARRSTGTSAALRMFMLSLEICIQNRCSEEICIQQPLL